MTIDKILSKILKKSVLNCKLSADKILFVKDGENTPDQLSYDEFLELSEGYLRKFGIIVMSGESKNSYIAVLVLENNNNFDFKSKTIFKNKDFLDLVRISAVKAGFDLLD
jgi:hypothetical protein